MDLTTGTLTAIISAVVSIAIAKWNSKRQKEIQRMNIRPYLSLKMELPPDDGIGGIPIKYYVHNLGNGVGFRSEIKEVFRTVDGDVQEGKPKVYQFDYDVIMTNSEIVFSVDWEHNNLIQVDPTVSTEKEIMDELVNMRMEMPRKSVLDNIRIHYYNSLDNKYEQVATIEYLNPDKPTAVKERISKPVRIDS